MFSIVMNNKVFKFSVVLTSYFASFRSVLMCHVTVTICVYMLKIIPYAINLSKYVVHLCKTWTLCSHWLPLIPLTDWFCFQSFIHSPAWLHEILLQNLQNPLLDHQPCLSQFHFPFLGCAKSLYRRDVISYHEGLIINVVRNLVWAPCHLYNVMTPKGD